MTLKEVQSLVNQGENKFTEFKRKANHPEKIMKEIVAFANSKGGHLFIGVDDNLSIPGLKYPEEEIYVLEKAIATYCRPKITYSLEIIALSAKKGILDFYIPPSEKSPHFVLDHPKKRWGKAYIRHEDKSIQASREVCEILRRKRNQKDISFQYGYKEQLLMQHLEENGKVTLKEFAKLAKINYFKSSRTLVLLVLANVLDIIPTEKDDFYVLKSQRNFY